MGWKDLELRLRALLHRGRMERDLQDELDLHLAMETRKNIASGMSESEAARQARLQFGGAAQVMEECREARGIGLVTTTLQDIRYAIRSFRRSPVFVLTVVGTIALGLGLDTALFTVFNAYYFQTVPVRDPHSLYEVSRISRTGNAPDFSWNEYQEFLAANPAFSQVLAYRNIGVELEGRNAAGILVSGEYFQMLGVGAAIGRTLVSDDAAHPGQEPVIVLSYSTWQRQFGSDPQIVGKKVLLRGYPFEIAGVASPGFTGLGARAVAFWAPLTMTARFEAGPDLFSSSQTRPLSIVGRMRDGVSVRQAQEGVNLWMQRLDPQSPDRRPRFTAVLTSRANYKPWRPMNTLLFGPILVAFSIVLLIGCANVANILLARAMSRQREIGIRLSLGASRARLVRQLLTESLLLSMTAAIAGFALSEAAIALCVRVLNSTLPAGINDFTSRIPHLSPDIRVFAFGLAFAILSALLFGLAPALQAARTSIVQASRGEFSGAIRPYQLRNSLVIAQITICVVLLITAAILLRGVDRIQHVNASLSSKDTIQLVIHEPFRARVLERLASDPDIEMLGAATTSPVDRKTMTAVSPAEGGALARIATNSVSPDYFALFEIPVLRGRNFTSEEARSGAPVAIISQTMAQNVWPHGQAIGQSLRLTAGASGESDLQKLPVVRVVGVVADEVSRWIANGEDKSIVYLPQDAKGPGTQLLIRVRGSAELARRRLSAGLTSIDPLAVERIERLQIREWVAEEAYSFRVAYWGSLTIGVLALLLTLSGIYGVLVFAVSQRTQEIGIRMALGATRQSVTGLFLKQSARLGLIGIVSGSTLALGISYALASVLVVSNSFDMIAYGSVALLVLGACAAAAYFPTRRAARIDPMISLRYD